MRQKELAAAFDAVRKAYETAYNAADAKAISELCTEDVVSMAPEVPDLRGRDAVRAYYQTWFDQFTATLSIGTDEVASVGDLGMGRGTWKATLKPKAGGPPIQLTGKYLNLSQPQPDGSLRIWRHIWNVPVPPPGS